MLSALGSSTPSTQYRKRSLTGQTGDGSPAPLRGICARETAKPRDDVTAIQKQSRPARAAQGRRERLVRWLGAWGPRVLHGCSCHCARKRADHRDEYEFLHRKSLDQSTSPPCKRVARDRGDSKDRPTRLIRSLGIAARFRAALFTRLETKVRSPLSQRLIAVGQ